MTEQPESGRRGPRRILSVGAAKWAVLLVPLLVGGALFLREATEASPDVLRDEYRPLWYYLQAGVAAFVWIVGTSVIFITFRSPALLPRIPRELALYVAYGPSSTYHPTVKPDRPIVVGDDSALSMGRLVFLALFGVPLFTLLAPALLGTLLQPSVYRPDETLAMLALGIVVLGWTILLFVRAGAGGRRAETQVR